jgi:hypothetical protein
VIEYVRRNKQWKQNRIGEELLQVPGADPYDGYLVEFWTHEIILDRERLVGKPKKGRPTLDDINALILHYLPRALFLQCNVLQRP